MKINIESFNNIEKKYGLYEDVIDGINYWIYSRFDIWNYALSVQNRNIGKTQNQPKRIQSRISSAVQLLGTLLFGKRVKKKEINLLFLIHERKVKINGIYECKYTETIRKYYQSYYVFERPYEMGHLKPTNTQNLIYLDEIAVKGNLCYYYGKCVKRNQYRKLLTVIEQHLEAAMKEWEEQLQVSLDLAHIAQIIARRILICKGKYKEYKRIFQKIHPKLILELVHYNMDSMIINEIAKQKGIRTVELQHGNIYDSHVAYHYDSSKEIKQLPDEIWLLSEYWKSVVHMPIEERFLIPMGYPYFESRIEKYKEKYKKQQDQRTVLFISQGTIGRQLSQFATAFAELSKEQFRILYKLHPGEISVWKEQYRELSKCGAIEVIEQREIDLYQLFAQSDIQAGVYSTALYEGIGFGLDTYICDLPYAEEMRSLYEDGYAKFVKTPEELLGFIQNEDQHSKRREFWTKDSENNMKKRIEEILNGNV